MHSLLKRQLIKAFGSDTELPDAMQGFVAAVNESYRAFDGDREMLHRAMELSSAELAQSNSELHAVFQAIPDLILRLDRQGNIVPLKIAEPADAEPPSDRLSQPRISKSLQAIPNPAVRTQFTQALAVLFESREAQTFDYVVATEFGDTFFEVRLVPLREDEAIAIIQDITARKQTDAERQKLNEQLIKASRQAGMAEVATAVLHNVGNVLNSVNVSATWLRENLRRSQILNLLRATTLLRDHAADTASFLTNDPKGQRLPDYLVRLGDRLAGEHQAWKKELDDLGKNLEHIKEIVAMQQGYARLGGLTEAFKAETLLEDALRMNAADLARRVIKVNRHYDAVRPVLADRHKALQILVNLVRNALQALDVVPETERILTVTVRENVYGRVLLQVQDNGMGIAAENLTRVFQYGFTTKSDGHGFGLHSSANAAREMNGHLDVHSDGPGFGATFSLDLPAAPELTKPPGRTPTTKEA